MNRNKFNTEKPTEHLAHLVLPETQTNASQNQKSYFFCQRTSENVNFENNK